MFYKLKVHFEKQMGDSESHVSLLEEEAKKRKERLANLKKSLGNKNESKDNVDPVEKSLPKYIYIQLIINYCTHKKNFYFF